MIDYAWKNITKRIGRSTLTVIGVTLMITLIITITGIVHSQKETMHQHASAGAGKIHIQPMLSGDTYPASGVDMVEEKAEELLTLIADHIQIELSTKIVFFAIEPPPYPTNPPAVLLVGIEPGKEQAFTGSVANDVSPICGVESFTDGDSNFPVILGQAAAAFYGSNLQPGDSLDILGTNFTVAGILDNSADQNVNNALIVPLDDAQALLDKGDFVSSILLTQKRVGDDEKIINAIRSSHPEMSIVDNNTIRRNLNEGIKVFEGLINVISLVVIIGATLLIMTVTLITVKERTREIGVFRALGAPSHTIIISILWEIFILSSMGSIMGGIISGVVMRFALEQNIFDLNHILKFIPLAIGMTLVSGFIPALQISRIEPILSLRHE